MAGLVLDKVSKAYGPVKVIHGVDLDIAQGEFIVFVGPSGCGKSTLLRMVAGLEDITGGTLTIDGRVVNDVPPSKRGIAMVFQSYALYPHMTVYDNMAFALRLAHVDKSEIDKRVRAAADILQLGPYLERLPKALSGGQRQRVAIGRATIIEPGLLLADEPTGNLDEKTGGEILDLLAEQHRRGLTIVMVTHDRTVAARADRIVEIHDGRVV